MTGSEQQQVIPSWFISQQPVGENISEKGIHDARCLVHRANWQRGST